MYVCTYVCTYVSPNSDNIIIIHIVLYAYCQCLNLNISNSSVVKDMASYGASYPLLIQSGKKSL